MGAPFRWLPYEGRRHAVPVELVAGDEGETLCGHPVLAPHDPTRRFPDGCWPECTSCDDTWRTRVGIRLRTGFADTPAPQNGVPS